MCVAQIGISSNYSIYVTGRKIFQILRLLLNVTVSENQTSLKHTLDVKLNQNNVIENSKHGQKSYGLESTINRHGVNPMHKADHQI